MRRRNKRSLRRCLGEEIGVGFVRGSFRERPRQGGRARRRPAVRAAVIAVTQYSCCVRFEESSEEDSNSRRNLLSSGIASGGVEDSSAICVSTSSCLHSRRWPFNLLCKEKFRYAHCAWEMLRSFEMSRLNQSLPVILSLVSAQRDCWKRNTERGSRP